MVVMVVVVVGVVAWVVVVVVWVGEVEDVVVVVVPPPLQAVKARSGTSIRITTINNFLLICFASFTR